jgi:uncharacterized protein DUF6880
MASKKTLNAGNLQALGAERLAALLMEVSQGNAAIKRRLRLELVGEDNPAELGLPGDWGCGRRSGSFASVL